MHHSPKPVHFPLLAPKVVAIPRNDFSAAGELFFFQDSHCSQLKAEKIEQLETNTSSSPLNTVHIKNFLYQIRK